MISVFQTLFLFVSRHLCFSGCLHSFGLDSAIVLIESLSFDLIILRVLRENIVYAALSPNYQGSHWLKFYIRVSSELC
jgi:hypothetical protein